MAYITLSDLSQVRPWPTEGAFRSKMPYEEAYTSRLPQDEVTTSRLPQTQATGANAVWEGAGYDTSYGDGDFGYDMSGTTISAGAEEYTSDDAPFGSSGFFQLGDRQPTPMSFLGDATPTPTPSPAPSTADRIKAAVTTPIGALALVALVSGVIYCATRK